MKKPIEEIMGWVIVFIFSFYLFQVLEEFMLSQPNFVFKNLILLIIPGPQDSLIELIQFLLYWATLIYVKFNGEIRARRK